MFTRRSIISFLYTFAPSTKVVSQSSELLPSCNKATTPHFIVFFINIYVDDFMAFGRYMRRIDICDTWRTLHMMEDNGLYRISPMLLFLSLDISLWLCTKFCCVDGASPREIQTSYIPHSGG